MHQEPISPATKRARITRTHRHKHELAIRNAGIHGRKMKTLSHEIPPHLATTGAVKFREEADLPEASTSTTEKIMSTISKARCTVAICVGLVLCATGSNASAAMIGGVASVHAGGSPGCQDAKAVPLTTLQNNLAMSASVACLGESASVDLYADAATTSIGMQGFADPVFKLGAQVNAFVGLIDRWLFTLPASVPTGTILSFPVSFTLDGSVAPGSSYRSSFSSFMNYVFTISDPQQGYSPFQTFQKTGSITTPGVYADTFSGIINLINRGPFFGMMADIEMNLWIPGLESGSIDFYNTAKIFIDLPDGVSVTTSTGLPLTFVTPPVVPEPGSVPEPATWMLLTIGLVGVVGSKRRQGKKWIR